MNKAEVNRMNTTVMAFMGDAVYEVYVRRKLMNFGLSHVNRLHRMCVKYVKAESQAIAINGLFESLTEDEQALVKRARNRHVGTKAKNASMMAYKWATAFEALIGYLYLIGDEERMSEIVEKAMEIIDNSGGHHE